MSDTTPRRSTVEHGRLAEATGRAEDDLFEANPWYEWGPYLSERAWGTVREDYSADGDAWSFFPHDHARSRAYRWNEDGMAGLSDIRHDLCLGLSLWNGVDPILKERMFGLTGPQGNHGEDAKEYWWYLDGLPSHALLQWRYHYPQAEFPYQRLIDENGRRGRDEFEYELLDTGVFDDGRYWIVDVTYAKASPTDVLALISVENHGADEASLDVLPTLWFRNTWRWSGSDAIPSLSLDGDAVVVDHARLGGYRFEADPAAHGTRPEAVFCENETNTVRLYGSEAITREARLIGADLGQCDLGRADLLRADLRAAQLDGADLRESLFVTHPALDAARGDGTTRLPAHLDRPAHWTPAADDGTTVAPPASGLRPAPRRRQTGRADGPQP